MPASALKSTAWARDVAAIVDAATTQEASKRESLRESQREAEEEEEEEEGEAPPDLEGMTEKI